jgi:hypothetical protein
MRTFTVGITQSISVDVTVEAETPEDAVNQVSWVSFPLPPRHEWQGSDDWEYTVFDEYGNEITE